VRLDLGNVKSVTIVAKSFSNDRERTLSFKADGNIRIRNLELEQVVIPEDDDDYPDIIEDFVHLYSLCDDSSAVKNIPHKKPGGMRALSRPICPSSVFDSSDKVPE
jgi:hypothetical protein